MTTEIRYHRIAIGAHNVFYREAGARSNPTLLLLHGFPSSSHMFRNLIPLLADRYHIVAPDLPGFGLTESPARGVFDYTFDNLAGAIDGFTEQLGLGRYAIYVFDYGAPIGFRLAVKHPERITAIISQNGNAYEEGLSVDGWAPIRAYWDDRSAEKRAAIRALLTPDFSRFQYVHGVGDASLIQPDGYLLDTYFLGRPGNDEIQLDLFGDYGSNVKLYPDFHLYFAAHKPPLLAVWGRNDPFFLPPGAEAFKRDNPAAEVHFFDTGHFALETHVVEIAHRMRDFLGRKIPKKSTA